MLINLSVENFLSFDKLTTLNMIPSSKIRKKLEHKIKVQKTSVLKYAVIYGANAAGKSNLVDVCSFIQTCVKDSIPSTATTKFCKTREANASRNSSFEIQFTVNNKFFAYGFDINLQSCKVIAEWLYELNPKGTAKNLFERKEGEKPVLGDTINLEDFEKSKFITYIEDFDEKSDTLFLSFMNLGKKYSDNSKITFFKEVYTFILKNLVIYTPQTNFNNFEYYYNDASLATINELIKTFDTGITQISIEEINTDELKKELPESVYNTILSDIEKFNKNSNNKNFKVSMRVNKRFYNIELLENTDIKVTTIKLKHGNSPFGFNFSEESDGTRRIFDLLDILLNKSENTVYVIDEMERSLHPKLTARFIELFDDMHKEKNVQLIFTTHEASIMEQQLFRRDEIWFVERNFDNESAVYSLDKFKERYDKKLSKAYLEGRYGAIPVFQSFNYKGE